MLVEKSNILNCSELAKRNNCRENFTQTLLHELQWESIGTNRICL